MRLANPGPLAVRNCLEAKLGCLIQVSRPNWLPRSIPELNGIRGIAVLAVVLYHCHDLISNRFLHSLVQWGWTGVNLFFVLSGFLITGIILESKPHSHFFREFYWRRLLRIWPVYLLLLTVAFWLNSSWRPRGSGVHWFYYALLLQNLTRVPLPGPLVPTWSLAIEEQYYLAWAPLARWIRSGKMMLWILLAFIAISPFARASHIPGLASTNTLLHLDGIAFGSLAAFLLHTREWSRRGWRILACAVSAIGLASTIYVAWGGSPFLDTAFALFFTGLLLAAVAWTETAALYARLLRMRVLTYFGQISYGLYMTHMLVFIVIGSVDAWLAHSGWWGAAAVVLIRLTVSTMVATLLWYGFERPILKLKRLYSGPAAKRQAIELAVPASPSRAV